MKPEYVYVASSWRNPIYPAIIETLKAAGIDHYDFRNPPEKTGFSWDEVGGPSGLEDDPISAELYVKMLDHPRAHDGFRSDIEALERADTVVLVLPCGKSAHLELGWAVGAGKRTAILLEDPIRPELMYRMVDHLSPSVFDLLGWLGVED